MNDETNVKTPYQCLTITKVDNAYLLVDMDDQIWVVEEEETDELKMHERLLWEIMNYFGFGGSRHDKERIRIVREKGDKFED